MNRCSTRPNHSSRRDFLWSLAAPPILAFRQIQPQLILFNGNILTMDEQHPHAQAVAIADGRFLVVGSNDEVAALPASSAAKVNLAGRTVVPGFIDAHTHPCYAGLRHLRQVDCDLRSIEDIQAAVRQRAAQTPPGDWVTGFKYDDTKTREGRLLTRQDLDAASSRHPVRIEHRGGHTSFVNSLALKLAGISEESLDPPGGHFDRDPRTRRLNGRVRENANAVFENLIPSSASRDDHRQAAKLVSHMMARAGVTSVHDAQGSPNDLRAYQDAHEAGELAVRVYCFIDSPHFDRVLAAGVRTGLGNEWVRVGAMKLTCDGSISERTARLSEPYIGKPNDCGMLVMEEPELYERVRKAHEAGWQVGVHANGDVAIDMTLRVFERVQQESPRQDPRFRLEHCTVINDGLVQRIRALGAIPNPFSTYVYYHGEKMREYGPERLDRMFAVRSFLDAGVRVTQTSDYPAGPFEPMMALRSMVTRIDSKGSSWGLKQRVSVKEALRVGTLHGAFASFEEKLKGSIEAGKLADLVVLGRDPLREDPMSLIDIPVERTMVGGRWAYEG